MEFRHLPLIWEQLGELHHSAWGVILDKPYLIVLPLLASACLVLFLLSGIAAWYLGGMGYWFLLALPIPEWIPELTKFILMVLCFIGSLFLNTICRYLGDTLQIHGLAVAYDVPTQGCLRALMSWPLWSWKSQRWTIPEPPEPVKMFQVKNTQWERMQRRQMERLLAFPYWALAQTEPEQALGSARDDIESELDGAWFSLISWSWTHYFNLSIYLGMGLFFVGVGLSGGDLEISSQGLSANGQEPIILLLSAAFCLWVGWGRFARVCYQFALYGYREGYSESIPYPDFLPEYFSKPLD
jgi:hypothetical protein